LELKQLIMMIVANRNIPVLAPLRKVVAPRCDGVTPRFFGGGGGGEQFVLFGEQFSFYIIFVALFFGEHNFKTI